MIWGTHARAPHIEAVFLTDVCREYRVRENTANNEENIHIRTCFSSLRNLCSPYHTSQQGADLVFEPTLKRQKQREKPNFERNFLSKQQKTIRNQPTHLTLLMLGFPKIMLEKWLISAYRSPLR